MQANCRVPRTYKGKGFGLATWVTTQRVNKESLSDTKRKRLDTLGFVWHPNEAAWEAGFQHLKIFADREGHSCVPSSHLENGHRLGQWVTNQRVTRHKLSEHRKELLEALGFVWNSRSAAWEEGLHHLERYKERFGHCRVHAEYQSHAFNLGRWVSKQRTNKKRMSNEYRQRLDMLGFIWKPYEQDWEEGFCHLKQYQLRVGHCCVPRNFEQGGFRLGQWVGVQRARKAALPEQRRRLLNELVFVWNQADANWQEGYDQLVRYNDREGHCRVPIRHYEGEFHLGRWVDGQRDRRSMPKDRRQKLDAVGFIWNPHQAGWENGFRLLQQYEKREGDCCVPKEHKEGGFALGTWVSNQRRKRDQLSKGRRERLNKIGFVWKAR